MRVARQWRPVRSICWRKSPPRRGGGDIDFATFYILPPPGPVGWGKMAVRKIGSSPPCEGSLHTRPSAPRAPPLYHLKNFRNAFSF